MGPEKLSLEEILDQAVQIRDSIERDAYLDKVCNNDRRLRSEIESLLKAYEEAGDFLESPVFDPDVTLGDSPLTERPGTVIGRYTTAGELAADIERNLNHEPVQAAAIVRYLFTAFYGCLKFTDFLKALIPGAVTHIS